MKTVNVNVQGKIHLPDSAELMTIDLEDFHETLVLRLNGRLYMPTIEWLEFVSRDVLSDESPNQEDARSAAFRGVSVPPQELMGVDDQEYDMCEIVES